MGNKQQQPRQRPPADMLREMSGHVSYEFQMLAMVGSELIDRGLNPDPVIQYALIESFLLHARQVQQFLAWDTSSKPDDVLAVDYFPEWSQKRTAPSELLKELLRDVNIRAAHLTLHRIEPHSYAVSEAGAELLREVRRFLELVRADLFMARPTASLCPEWAKEPVPGAFVVDERVGRQGDPVPAHRLAMEGGVVP